MIDILPASSEMLAGADFSTRVTSAGDGEVLTFEDATILGFLFAYNDPRELIKNWVEDTDGAVKNHQFGLRLAGQKAWNAYVVLLSAAEADFAQFSALSAIEEDLTGTRKIARSGITEVADLRAALLSLFPLQTAPKLEAVDILAEIRQRTTELPPRVVDAFLSNADGAVVVQVLEEKP